MTMYEAICRITNTLGTTECAKTAKCKPYTHHYEECVTRVTGKQEAGEDPKEDCVEECMPTDSSETATLLPVHKCATLIRG